MSTKMPSNVGSVIIAEEVSQDSFEDSATSSKSNLGKNWIAPLILMILKNQSSVQKK